MVVDTSALVAILLEEPGFEVFATKTIGAPVVFVGAQAALETTIVLSSRLKRDPRQEIRGLLRRMNARIIPWNEDHYEAAVTAFLRFGKGRHPAKLNFGDCMSYAIAAVSGMPLLYAGEGFALTDIPAA